jgi:hypothetical protein
MRPVVLRDRLPEFQGEGASQSSIGYNGTESALHVKLALFGQELDALSECSTQAEEQLLGTLALLLPNVFVPNLRRVRRPDHPAIRARTFYEARRASPSGSAPSRRFQEPLLKFAAQPPT